MFAGFRLLESASHLLCIASHPQTSDQVERDGASLVNTNFEPCIELLHVCQTMGTSHAVFHTAQRTFFEYMSTFFLHDILRALPILLTVCLSGYV